MRDLGAQLVAVNPEVFRHRLSLRAPLLRRQGRSRRGAGERSSHGILGGRGGFLLSGAGHALRLARGGHRRRAMSHDRTRTAVLEAPRGARGRAPHRELEPPLATERAAAIREVLVERLAAARGAEGPEGPRGGAGARGRGWQGDGGGGGGAEGGGEEEDGDGEGAEGAAWEGLSVEISGPFGADGRKLAHRRAARRPDRRRTWGPRMTTTGSSRAP